MKNKLLKVSRLAQLEMAMTVILLDLPNPMRPSRMVTSRVKKIFATLHTLTIKYKQRIKVDTKLKW